MSISWYFKRIRYEFLNPSFKIGKFFKSFRYKRLGKNNLLIWDLSIMHPTYDIIWFYAIAQVYLRLKNKNSFKLLIILPIKDFKPFKSDQKAYYTESNVQWRIENVILPLSSYFSAKEIIYSRRDDSYKELISSSNFIFPLTYKNHYPSGITDLDYQILFNEKNLEFIKPKDYAQKYMKNILKNKNKNNKKILTINLRKIKYLVERNSNEIEWLKIANLLNKIFFVIIVPDNDDHDISIFKKFYISKEAQWNIDLRIALYSISSMNLFVNSGPCSLCIFSSFPYMMFNLIPNKLKIEFENIWKKRGFRKGSQPKFLKQNQKWIWKEDNFQNIKNELKLYFKNEKI